MRMATEKSIGLRSAHLAKKTEIKRSHRECVPAQGGDSDSVSQSFISFIDLISLTASAITRIVRLPPCNETHTQSSILRYARKNNGGDTGYSHLHLDALAPSCWVLYDYAVRDS